MKCPKCQAELPEQSIQCTVCGYDFGSGVSNSSEIGAKRVLKPLSGFRRTLSTELVERQTELRTSMALNKLVQTRVYEPGDILIHKGDANRDLYFLTEGSVEISTRGEGGDLILNEVEPPYILGDIGFLSGFPRTATATAKSKAAVFVLSYENLRNLFGEFPEWLHPLLTSFASGVKSLHFRIAELKREILEREKNRIEMA